MEKWTAKEIKENGAKVINNYIEFINGDIDFKKFNKQMNEIIVIDRTDSLDTNAFYNKNALDEFLKVATIIKDLVLKINKTQVAFSNDNLTILHILDIVLISETQIKGNLEYNTLLDAIPLEAKEKISKELLKPKDIEKDKADLVSIEFLTSNSFEKEFVPLFEKPMKEYAVIKFCILLNRTLMHLYGAKAQLKVCNSSENSDYESTKDHIQRVLEFSQRVPSFEKTKTYKQMIEYQNIQNIQKNAVYESATEKIKELIPQMIKAEEGESISILDDFLDKTFKQRWWHNESAK